MSLESNYPEGFVPFVVNEDPDQSAPGGLASSEGSGTSVDIFLWGDIGMFWGTYGDDIHRALVGKNPQEINLYISSGGGDVVQAFEMYNILKGHPATVNVFVFSLAASAATLVAAAGDRRVMGKQSMWMIHEGSMFLYGNYSEKELKSRGAQSEVFNKKIAQVYDELTGLGDIDLIRDLMAMETWWGPEEALAMGFITEVVEAVSLPFEQVGLSEAECTLYFSSHLSSFMQGQLEGKGFERISASAISAKLGPSKRSVSNMKNPFSGLLSFLKDLGYSVTNSKGDPVTAEEAETQIQAALEKGGAEGFTDFLGEAMRKQITELVATSSAEKSDQLLRANASLEEKLTAVVASLKEEVAALTEKVSAQTNPAGETPLEKLQREVAEMKAAKSGGGGNQDPAVIVSTEKPPKHRVAFGPGSQLHNTVVGNGLISASEIAAIEARASKLRAEKQ